MTKETKIKLATEETTTNGTPSPETTNLATNSTETCAEPEETTNSGIPTKTGAEKVAIAEPSATPESMTNSAMSAPGMPKSTTDPAMSTPETAQVSQVHLDQLDEEEEEFRQMRRDLPGVKGSSTTGIVTISVAKKPGANKNEFFRTHRTFMPIVPIVDLEVGMDKHFFAVTRGMVKALAGIGITVTDHRLYFTITPRGAFRIVPVRQATADGEQNEYDRTKEIGRVRGIDEWVRLFTDMENKCYEVFPAPAGRYDEPNWPDLTHARIFKLGFRDKGRLLDSVEHPLFLKWTGRD